SARTETSPLRKNSWSSTTSTLMDSTRVGGAPLTVCVPSSRAVASHGCGALCERALHRRPTTDVAVLGHGPRDSRDPVGAPYPTVCRAETGASARHTGRYSDVGNFIP